MEPINGRVAVKGFSGGALEGSEKFSKLSLRHYRGSKRIDRIFEGFLAFYGTLMQVPDG